MNILSSQCLTLSAFIVHVRRGKSLSCCPRWVRNHVVIPGCLYPTICSVMSFNPSLYLIVTRSGRWPTPVN